MLCNFRYQDQALVAVLSIAPGRNRFISLSGERAFGACSSVFEPRNSFFESSLVFFSALIRSQGPKAGEGALRVLSSAGAGATHYG
jgi:hypothetical protein